MKASTLIIGLVFLVFISCKNQKFNDGIHTFKNEKGTLVVSNNKATYRFDAYRQDIIKTTWFKKGEMPEEENPYFVVMENDKSIHFRVKESHNRLHIFTSEIMIEVTKSPFVVNFYEINKSPLLISSKEPIDSLGSKIMYFKSPTTEAFYGMGQKSIPVNRRGYAFDTRNQHIGGYTKEYATMQVNIPYVYSSENYGVFFDNTYTGHFDFVKSNPDEWTYRADGGDFTFYFTKGATLQDLQNNYYDLTGYPTIPPKWAFGLLQSKCGYINQDEVYGVIKKFEENNLPLDAIILDAFWFGGYGDEYPQLMGNFTWYKNHFPEPKEYMSKLKSKGIKTLTINEPQINVHSENHGMLMEKDWLMKVDGKPFVQESFWAGSASLLDLTNPDVQSWLWEKQKANVDLGLDAFWVDLTEPDVSTPEGIFYGGPEPKVHNIYSYLFAKTLYDGFLKDYPERRLFNITRAGTAGMHRMGAFHWSGDASKTFLALKYQVPMLIGCAMSGMPHYSSDIGGFTNAWDTISVPWNQYRGGPGITSPELYTRWFQFGVFSPLLRPHSGEGQSCEPFAFDDQTLRITSEYLNLRYRLIPYIYSYAYKTASTGEQLIKPLFMCFSDEGLVGRDYEYMFGQMLVAPVFQSGQTEREVFLPKLEGGLKWIDFWDNTEYEGGRLHVVNAPIDKIPVFVKGGSIIVKGKIKKYVEESVDDTLFVDVYPGKKISFELYEDDGTSMGYTRGEFATTLIESEKDENMIKIRISPIKGNYAEMLDRRTWKVRINQVGNIDKLILNNQVVDKNTYTINLVQKSVEIQIDHNLNELLELEISL